MAHRRRGILFLGAVACAALAAEARAQTTVTVTISTTQNAFYPRVVVINEGDTVRWRYAGGGMAHNVVSDDGSIDSGAATTGVIDFSHTFPSAGSFPYRCTVHASVGMRGVVYVNSAATTVRTARAPNEVAYTIGAWDFEGRTSLTSTSTAATEGHTRNINGASDTELRAGVQLPSGSEITGLELAACDYDGANNFTVSLQECPDGLEAANPGSACNQIASVSTMGTPTCGFFASSPASWIVNNFGYSYHVDVTMANSTNLRLRSVRVFYRKAISPPPATASFTDVPTNHLFFPFIEALRASGITLGCSATEYCPGNNVTRGQMAAFLSRALGLSWQP